jgi:biopolymer transport protein ExbD
MRPVQPPSAGDAGFQIAPMIDVVFVILVFFMALAAQIRLEHSLQSRLPGVAAGGAAASFVDEQIIRVDEAGDVTLNDERLDTAGDAELRELRATLVRLKAAGDAAGTPVVVTVMSHPDSAYERTIRVLDALAAARITQVSFAAEEES